MPCALCPNPALCNPVCRAFEFAPDAVKAQMREACAKSGQMTEQEVSAHVEAGEMPTPDQVIELAQALEQKRGLQIVADVKALGACIQESHFQYGWESACEEIEERLRTEEWPLCLKPVGTAAPKGEAGEMEAAKGEATPLPTHPQQEKK